MALEFIWVELLSGQAYTARISVALSDLQRVEANVVEIRAIFGPNGLLIIPADPLRRTEADTETRDAARICGTRIPEADRDYTADPGALSGLPEALATAILTPPHLGCQA